MSCFHSFAEKGWVRYASALSSWWERFWGTTCTRILYWCWLNWKFCKVHKPQLQPKSVCSVCLDLSQRREAGEGDAFCCRHDTSTSGELICIASLNFLKLQLLFLLSMNSCVLLQELCYDYGYVLNSVVSAAGDVIKLPCYCGVPDCRKRLY